MYRIQINCSQRFWRPLAAHIVLGGSSASLLVDGLGWFCLYQLSFQVTEPAVAPQNFDSLLLYRGWSDTQILQTGQSRVLHVCCVKLEKQSSGLGIEKLKVSLGTWQEDWRCREKRGSYPFNLVGCCPGLKWVHCKKLGSKTEKINIELIRTEQQ